MASFLPLVGLAKWPLTLSAAVLVFGVSSEGTLSLISEHVHTPAASTPAPARSAVVVRMPAPATVAPQQAETRLAALSAGRALAGSAASPRPAIEAGIPTMQVTIPGLVVRSHPVKTSPQVGVLRQGDVVEIHGKQGGWMLVHSARGAVGWVFGKYLALKPAASDSSVNSLPPKGTVS
jgi:uncharacterized protein YraI